MDNAGTGDRVTGLLPASHAIGDALPLLRSVTDLVEPHRLGIEAPTFLVRADGRL